MKDKKLLKSVSSLVLLTLIGKLLSLVSRLTMTNIINIDAISIFSLINPVMILLINLSQMGLPLAISTLVSKRPEHAKRIFVSGFLLTMVISIFLMFAVYFLSPTIAHQLLKNADTLPAIYGLGLLIPLVATSALTKGLYIGQGKIKYTSFSTMAEEISRLIFIIFFIKYFSDISPAWGALGAVLGICVGELAQTAYLFFIAPHYQKAKTMKILFLRDAEDSYSFKELLAISLPVIISRLIGSLGYFLEPIIFTRILSDNNMTMSEITRIYGVINGYAFPILLMPGFLSLAISNVLLQKMTNLNEKKEYAEAKRILVYLLTFTLIVGSVISFTFFLFADNIMKLLYGSNIGASYLRILSLPFILFYLEAPLIAAMHATNQTKTAAKVSGISALVRVITLAATTATYKGYGIAISELFSILFVVILDGFFVYRFFARLGINSLFKRQHQK